MRNILYYDSIFYVLPPHGGIRQYPFKYSDINILEQYA